MTITHARWYPLVCKPGQNKEGYRGELELKLGFTVKATENNAGGSVADLRRGTKGSLTSLNKVAGTLGGSLLSLGGKERKNIKKLAKSVGKKVEKVGEKARMTVEAVKAGREKESEGRRLSRLEEGEMGWGSLTNRDPGVNSDDEDEMEPVRDDMFQFDRLSHRSSIRSELSLGKLGMVSPALTPDLAALRRGDTSSSIAPATNRQQQQEDTDSMTSFTRRDLEETDSLTSLTRREQEDKTSLASYSRRDQTEDNTSMASFTSHQTLPDDSSLPSYSQAMSRKKKIIPVVQSEPESSPSPEQPSSPMSSPRPRDSASSTLGSLSSRFRQSQALEPADLGNKLKNSFSKNLLIGCAVCTYDSHFVSGFKDKGDKAEKVATPGQQSRTTSNTSLGPPSGTRVVLGRETSPTPSSQNQRIPPEILAKFQGKTREDLIELVVGLQANAETQGKKLKDLEDYLDGLLIRVMETAPVLLQKDSLTTKPGRQ